MSTEWLQISALLGAFWTAVLLYRGDRPVRFVAALALGAGLAHGGWALLHLPAVLEHPWSLLDVSRGFSVLFVPLGLLLLTPTASAFATLPLALAVARVGCLAAGCCHGAAGEPTPLAEIGGLAMLHVGVRWLPARCVAPAVLTGIGVLRLATEPWRAPPPLGAPIVPPAVVAALWAAAGLTWALAGALSRHLRRSPVVKPCAVVDPASVTRRDRAGGATPPAQRPCRERTRVAHAARRAAAARTGDHAGGWISFPLAGPAESSLRRPPRRCRHPHRRGGGAALGLVHRLLQHAREAAERPPSTSSRSW